MARGQQKLQSQQRAQKKAQEMKRQQGHDQKAAAQAALIHKCSVCMVNIDDDKRN
uniref:Zinc finger protein n=1 Tax=Sarcoptes scabiei TaxID=52283 RepID=A0A834RB98_SARSC